MNVRMSTVAAVFAVGIASASPIGILGIGSQGFVQATLTSIDFTTDPSAVPSGPLFNGSVNAATNLTFSGGPLATGEGITINNSLPFGTPPPAGATMFNPFLQFALHPTLKFILTGIEPGSANHNCAGLATGESCSIDVAGVPSPVLLQRSGTNTNVSIGFFGIATDGTSPDSQWTGGFSATLPGTLPIDVVHFFCGADAVCTAAEAAASPTLDVRSVSGSFTASPIPESGTISLFLGGFALMAIGLARHRQTGTAKRS